jgi:glycosyltransferase involved in cell wall biosynthesis
MSRTLAAVLVTLGDPATLTGGYLFHRRIAELAPRYAARLDFVSVPQRPFPVAVMDGPRLLRGTTRAGAEVVVLDSIATAYLGPWLRMRSPARPFVGMLHQPPGGIDHGPPRRPIQAWLDRLAYGRMSRLLVASDDLAAQIRREVDRPERVRVVPPGRDVAPRVVTPSVHPRRGRRAALLCVGNWVERKGILSLLDAFSRLDPAAATLHLVGDTASASTYGRQVWLRLGTADLDQRVVVHGPLPLAEVAGLYATVDAFVLPSVREPYGTVYGEAMAFGLPVVGWRAGNLPHLAQDQREGLLVNPGDIAGLAAALQRLVDEPVLRDRLGAAARQRALSRPTWDQVAGLFFDHLREVAA